MRRKRSFSFWLSLHRRGKCTVSWGFWSLLHSQICPLLRWKLNSWSSSQLVIPLVTADLHLITASLRLLDSTQLSSVTFGPVIWFFWPLLEKSDQCFSLINSFKLLWHALQEITTTEWKTWGKFWKYKSNFYSIEFSSKNKEKTWYYEINVCENYINHNKRAAVWLGSSPSIALFAY